MAGVDGKSTIVALKPTTTWESAATIGANSGILPSSIDKIDKGGTIDFDAASGLAHKSQWTTIMEEANPTIAGAMRWNGAWWCFLANFIGDDTKSGVSAPWTHTFNWQDDPTLVGITLGIEINNTANGILEVPSLKVTGISFEPADGFWNFSVSTLGDTVLHAGDATFDGTAADNVTYATKAQRMRYKANQIRINSQSGGALGSGDVLSDISNMSINLNRDYDPMDDVLKGASTGTELRRAEPIQQDTWTMTLSFEKKTLDLATHLNELGSEYKADVIMTETISSVAHSLTFEFGHLVATEPQTALNNGARIPMTHNYELAYPSATPTGLSTANPLHILLDNNSDLTYETNA